MKKVLVFLALVVSSFFLAKTVSSDCGGQYGQYGGCNPSLTILVDKFVGKPNTSVTNAGSADYVDNLSPSDPRFKANQTIFFKTKVKNTSNTTLYNVTVKDFLPSYIEPIEGPGIYDGKARTITFNAGDFAQDEEKVYYFKMQIDSVQYLPADKGLFCIVNQVKAYNDRASDDDTSQFCVEKEVVGAKKVPSAGPEMGVLLLGLNFAGIGMGMFLRKKSI